jgi:hypothetical protein
MRNHNSSGFCLESPSELSGKYAAWLVFGAYCETNPYTQ